MQLAAKGRLDAIVAEVVFGARRIGLVVRTWDTRRLVTTPYRVVAREGGAIHLEVGDEPKVESVVITVDGPRLRVVDDRGTQVLVRLGEGEGTGEADRDDGEVRP